MFERRAIVLREYVDLREFVFIKIAGELNIADLELHLPCYYSLVSVNFGLCPAC